MFGGCFLGINDDCAMVSLNDQQDCQTSFGNTHSHRSQTFNRIYQVVPMSHQSNTQFLEPTQPTSPNGISVESTVFPQYTLVTNGSTDCRTTTERDR